MKKIYRVLEIIVTIVLTGGIFLGLSNIVERKNSHVIYDDFWKQNDNYDVLFFGSSHMMNTALPNELWKKYGIKSYNMANAAEAIPTTYWVMENAFRKTIPKVALVEVFFVGSESKVTLEQESQLHNFFDSAPLTITKYHAITDLFENPKDCCSYLFNYSLYHTRWNDLNEGDFYPAISHNRGAIPLLQHYTPIIDENKVRLYEINALSVEYLTKIKRLCDNKGVKLVFVLNPYAAWTQNYTGNWDYERITNELGVEILDLREANVVNIDLDFADGAHLNISGARKVTFYYGDFLISKGYVENGDTKKDEKWAELYKGYIRNKIELLSECKDAESLLTDLNDIDFDFDIIIRDEQALSDLVKKEIQSNCTTENSQIAYDNNIENEIVINIYEKDTDSLLLKKEY